MAVQSATDLATRLQDAICGGDADSAKQLVGQLCRQGSVVRVFPQSGENLLVRVYFRDRDNSLEKPRLFQFSTASTLAELKLRITAELEIPRQAQCCVTAGQIPPDSTPLGDLANGHEVTVHLYLLAKEQFRNHWDTKRLQVAAAAAAPTPPAPPAARRPQPAPPAPPAAKPPAIAEPGWDCPKCTFRNNPARPGCEICGSERPAGFLNPGGGGAGDDEEAVYEEVP